MAHRSRSNCRSFPSNRRIQSQAQGESSSSDNNRKVPVSLQKREGVRKNLLTAAEHTLWVQALNLLRKRHEAIDSTLAACIARGILKRTRPRAVAEGALKISDQWARDAMSLCGFRVRRATTDRTVTCDEIRLKGVPFFKELSQKKVKCRSLVFNLDEFFCNTSTSSLSLTRHWAGQQSRGLMQ